MKNQTNQRNVLCVSLSALVLVLSAPLFRCSLAFPLASVENAGNRMQLPPTSDWNALHTPRRTVSPRGTSGIGSLAGSSEFLSECKVQFGVHGERVEFLNTCAKGVERAENAHTFPILSLSPPKRPVEILIGLPNLQHTIQLNHSPSWRSLTWRVLWKGHKLQLP